MNDVIIRIFTGLVGTFAFSIAFNVRGRFLILTSLGGLLSSVCFEVSVLLGVAQVLCAFITSSLITLYSEFLARTVKTPTTTFIITSLIPLVPGSALYYTMSNALAKKWVLFFENAYYALKIAMSLAAGVIFVTTTVQLFSLLINYKNAK